MHLFNLFSSTHTLFVIFRIELFEFAKINKLLLTYDIFRSITEDFRSKSSVILRNTF